MNILFVASECVPFIKVGGLADVVGALPGRLAARGHDVRVVVPRYRSVRSPALPLLPGKLIVPMGGVSYEEGFLRAGRGAGGVPVYFIENARYYDRPEVYGTPDGDYGDNRERFIFFCRAALETAKAVGFKPDIVHCHDWQTGLVPAYLKTLYRIDAFFGGTASVFTIHNIAYQGMFDAGTVEVAGFSRQDFVWNKLEYYGMFNFLKVGLSYADMLSTVSPTYAREIELPAGGRGMEGVLRSRHRDLVGILNGIDTTAWNPSTDALLPARYTSAQRDGKRLCRRHLQKICGLPQDEDALLLGAVSRLDPQKGWDLVCSALPQLMRRGVQVAVLGRGDRRIQEALVRMAARYPRQCSVAVDFNEERAHAIYAGADAFLMPSLFEPCGLGQLIALAYGTVPIVTRTGGLADTVTDVTPRGGRGTGFVMATPDVAGLLGAVDRALAVRASRTGWARLVKNAFAADFSWDRAVPAYERLYADALERRGRWS